MSYYCKEVVLRIPLKDIDFEPFIERLKTIYGSIDNILTAINSNDVSPIYDIIEETFPDDFSYGGVAKFSPAPTEMPFIDYILAENCNNAMGDWGQARALYEEEKIKYAPIFQRIFPKIDMNKVHLVEFCWYNCSEAPDYYDETTYTGETYDMYRN